MMDTPERPEGQRCQCCGYWSVRLQQISRDWSQEQTWCSFHNHVRFEWGWCPEWEAKKA